MPLASDALVKLLVVVVSILMISNSFLFLSKEGVASISRLKAGISAKSVLLPLSTPPQITVSNLRWSVAVASVLNHRLVSVKSPTGKTAAVSKCGTGSIVTTTVSGVASRQSSPVPISSVPLGPKVYAVTTYSMTATVSAVGLVSMERSINESAPTLGAFGVNPNPSPSVRDAVIKYFVPIPVDDPSRLPVVVCKVSPLHMNSVRASELPSPSFTSDTGSGSTLIRTTVESTDKQSSMEPPSSVPLGPNVYACNTYSMIAVSAVVFIRVAASKIESAAIPDCNEEKPEAVPDLSDALTLYASPTPFTGNGPVRLPVVV